MRSSSSSTSAWRARRDERLAAIAAKAVKETRYHLRYSSSWLVRLGDGTAESHARVQSALERLWPLHGGALRGG